MEKIILAFDSFKGSMTSSEVAKAAEAGIKEVLPDCQTLFLPMADGGEGTTETICSVLDVNEVVCSVNDPLMRQINAAYSITRDGKTAVIEMAAASGLPLVEMEFRNPMNTTTYGTGELMLDAINRGCNKIILGIGGSATNDGGMGVLKALGVKFYDAKHNELEPIGDNLSEVRDFDDSELSRYKDIEIMVACDVDNPFYGPTGAAYVFAPQKGASETVVKMLDSGLKNFANVINKKKGIDVSNLPGAGASGGLGGGLKAFFNAPLLRGSDVILDLLDFDKLLEGVDLVLTGEGKIDAQTRHGKALSGILNRAKKKNVPVVVIAGSVDNTPELEKDGYTAIFSIQRGPTTLERAISKEYATNNVKNIIVQIMRIINRFGN